MTQLVLHSLNAIEIRDFLDCYFNQKMTFLSEITDTQ